LIAEYAHKHQIPTRQQQRSYNQDGQLISQTLGASQRKLAYDGVGNLIAIIIGTQNILELSYDAADRLIAANDQQWQYDNNSNRIRHQDPNGSTVYNLEPKSNRLSSSNGINYQVYRLDANGNPLQDKNHSYRYDTQNRLIAVDSGKTAQYRYNALGQRIHKQTQTGELFFTYDETGKLLGEYGNNGNNITAYQETVWLGNLPVAVVKDNIPYAIHSDHLGTPRVITDAQQREIWQWLDDPFGTTQANEAAFTYNLRFAGQYYDKETGLHYNYHRYYNPKTGRYSESDPIGLAGGLNTYGYVGGNPMNRVDPEGLNPVIKWVITKVWQNCKWVYKKVVSKVDDVGDTAKSAEARAKEIHGALDSRAQRARTTAVTKTEEGVDVVTSSERRLSPAQRALLKPNEAEGIGEGHAEITGINAAKDMGLTPTGTAASRPICPSCATNMSEQGIQPLSPLK
jgi:RHS repeat-associated protein